MRILEKTLTKFDMFFLVQKIKSGTLCTYVRKYKAKAGNRKPPKYEKTHSSSSVPWRGCGSLWLYIRKSGGKTSRG